MKRVAIPLILLMVVLLDISGYFYHCEASEENQLGNYYIDFSDLASNWPGSFDQNSIPLTEYGGKIGTKYQPVGIAHYALGNYDLYLKTRNDKYKEVFLRQADWFCNNLIAKRLSRSFTFGIWEYKFDFEPYWLKAPWPSAMSQGEGISVLLRAYQLTNDQEYLKFANLALKSFEVPLNEGGVKYEDKEGFVWYEEYPATSPPHVLNGFIFALLGLYDFYKITRDKKALELFNRGIETIKANLHLYDIGFWSTYDLQEYEGEKNFIFRFVTETQHPVNEHPIDKITIVEVDDAEHCLSSLDVGPPGDTVDTSKNGNYIYYIPGKEDWGERKLLDNRTIRNYGNYEGVWHQAPFQLRFIAKCSSKYYLTITYKDVSIEPVYVEIYQGKYFRIGQLNSTGNNVWRTDKIQIPTTLLVRHIASEKYHRLHIKLLSILYEITREKLFLEFTEKFDSYLGSAQ